MEFHPIHVQINIQAKTQGGTWVILWSPLSAQQPPLTFCPQILAASHLELFPLSPHLSETSRFSLVPLPVLWPGHRLYTVSGNNGKG